MVTPLSLTSHFLNLRTESRVYNLEDGQEKLALVELSSQPFAIKSALADYAHSAGDTEKIQGKEVVNLEPEANQVLSYIDGQWVPTSISNSMVNIDEYQIPDREI